MTVTSTNYWPVHENSDENPAPNPWDTTRDLIFDWRERLTYNRAQPYKFSVCSTLFMKITQYLRRAEPLVSICNIVVCIQLPEYDTSSIVASGVKNPYLKDNGKLPSAWAPSTSTSIPLEIEKDISTFYTYTHLLWQASTNSWNNKASKINTITDHDWPSLARWVHSY